MASLANRVRVCIATTYPRESMPHFGFQELVDIARKIEEQGRIRVAHTNKQFVTFYKVSDITVQPRPIPHEHKDRGREDWNLYLNIHI